MKMNETTSFQERKNNAFKLALRIWFPAPILGSILLLLVKNSLNYIEMLPILILFSTTLSIPLFLSLWGVIALINKMQTLDINRYLLIIISSTLLAAVPLPLWGINEETIILIPYLVTALLSAIINSIYDLQKAEPNLK